MRRVCAVVCALLLGLSACAGRPEASATAVVVVHDRNEPAPALGEDVRAQLRGLAADPHTDGAVAEVLAAGRARVETVDLEPRRPNGQIERGPRIEELVDGRMAALGDAVRRAAVEGTDTDVLRALEAATRTGASWIVVLTGGLSTTDPLDLRTAGWDQDPRALAADLAARGLLPDLRHHRVTFVGLGRTAGPQPPLGPREQTRLRAMWLAVCAAARADSCAVDDMVRAADPPVSGLAAPIVPVPAVATRPDAAGGQEIAVPSSMLFGPESCDVVDPPGALAALGPVADRLRAGGWRVRISGRTAPVGDTGLPLSRCRAGVAADLLRDDLGVPPGAIAEVRGDGSLADPPGAGQDRSGRPDPVQLAALRRVVFTLIPQES